MQDDKHAMASMHAGPTQKMGGDGAIWSGVAECKWCVERCMIWWKTDAIHDEKKDGSGSMMENGCTEKGIWIWGRGKKGILCFFFLWSSCNGRLMGYKGMDMKGKEWWRNRIKCHRTKANSNWAKAQSPWDHHFRKNNILTLKNKKSWNGHWIWMVIGCGLVSAIIFFAPALGHNRKIMGFWLYNPNCSLLHLINAPWRAWSTVANNHAGHTLKEHQPSKEESPTRGWKKHYRGITHHYIK